MIKFLFLVTFSVYSQAVTFQFNFGAGFNDTTPTTHVGGNTGNTLGAQRQILFQAAAAIWGARIQSNIPIVVDVKFTALSCSPTGAVLGFASPQSVFTSFPPTGIMANTWYPESLYNAVTDSDNFPLGVDIKSQFNASIDAGMCLGGKTFYYGINGSAPSGKIQLFSTVLHELGHGLGISSFSNSTDGSFNSNIPTIFDRFIYDTQVGLAWTDMTNAQRLISMTNDPFLVWNGVNVNNNANNFIISGKDPNSSLVRLFAPATFQSGSSVSHFSSDASPDLLMEPVLGNIAFDQVDLTPALFKDIGYSIITPSSNIIFINGFEN
jgi:hypothetical protein